ncbi:MAG TPA: response regulator [Bacteroidales bacterium]|nr:MAG: Autoinducer 2 sensor kinase/phosphatase LuxQ [Bacteroidetes bacterium ADurb.Bin217]HPM12148.1 response regulator [Bacteroidales bacterium]
MHEPLKILLLENDDNDVELIQTLLAEELCNYEITYKVCDNKVEYIDLLQTFNPDVILTDFMLPQYNGFKAIEDARKIYIHTPIIIVTGSLSEEDAAESIKHGASDYVVKQRIERLPIAIANALKLSKEMERSHAQDVEIQKLKEQTGLQIKTCFHAIEKAPVSIIITDKLGIIEFANTKFIETTGYSLEELVGKTPAVLKSGNHTASVYADMWKQILKGDDWKGEFINKRKNGELFYADVSISSIKNQNNEIKHFIGIQIDITQDKLQRKELELAKEKAEESDKLKSLFLANLSHEIRTPMNGILGFSDLLKDTDLTPEERMHYVSIIEQSGHRMLNIINDLIDISKIEAGQMTVLCEPVEICRIGQELYDFFLYETNKKHLELIYSPDKESCYIETDVTKISQILSNLIKNAIKFTKHGSIEFGFVVEEHVVKFFVKDTGIGIHPKLQEFIFDRFRQADLSAYKSEEGIGLGLSICKAFVEMLGGEIWVESQLDVGSTFIFTLPVDVMQSVSTDLYDVEQPIFQEGLTILIAEDDIANFILLEKILRTHTNARILHAQDGEQALRIFKEEPIVDVALVDIKMPLIDGIELTKMIKKMKPDTPIIIQTAFASNSIKQQAIDAGCSAIISKPIQKRKVLRIISDCLK